MKIPKANYQDPNDRRHRSTGFHPHTRNWIRTRASILAFLFFTTPTAPAAVLRYAGELRIDPDPVLSYSFGSFSSGDKFDFVLSIDDVADTGALASFGSFNDALLDFSMTRRVSNSGHWNPVYATFVELTTTPFAGDISTTDFSTASASGQGSVQFSLTAANTSPAGGIAFGPFKGIDFSFIEATGTAVSDTGIGQSFSQQLEAGNGQLRIQDFDQLGGSLSFDRVDVDFTVTKLSQIPEPRVGLLLVASVSLLIGRRGRPTQFTG